MGRAGDSWKALYSGSSSEGEEGGGQHASRAHGASRPAASAAASQIRADPNGTDVVPSVGLLGAEHAWGNRDQPAHHPNSSFRPITSDGFVPGDASSLGQQRLSRHGNFGHLVSFENGFSEMLTASPATPPRITSRRSLASAQGQGGALGLLEPGSSGSEADGECRVTRAKGFSVKQGVESSEKDVERYTLPRTEDSLTATDVSVQIGRLDKIFARKNEYAGERLVETSVNEDRRPLDSHVQRQDLQPEMFVENGDQTSADKRRRLMDPLMLPFSENPTDLEEKQLPVLGSSSSGAAAPAGVANDVAGGQDIAFDASSASIPLCNRRGSPEALLAAFPGPDDGLAARWSVGPLELPGAEHLLPERIAACLRPYQRDGVRWLYERLFVENRGCLLTDEMGLGKTVQVACCLVGGLYCCSRKAGDGSSSNCDMAAVTPVLILCPPSLVDNWARELRRWGPFGVEVLSPGNRVRALQRLEAGLSDVLVASRGLLRDGVTAGSGGGEGLGSMEERLHARKWGCVIVDEVHQAKNPKGLLHRALASLNSTRKLGLTGTPLQNSLTDVWALLRIVGANGGWDLSSFESRFGRPITRGQKRKASVRDLSVREDALKEFKELLDKSCLRRTKAEVALMLPGKNDRIVPCPLSEVQQAAYRNLLASPDFQLALGKRQVCICGAGRPCFCGTGPVWRYVHRRQADLKGLEDEWAAADDCVCRGRAPPKCLSLSLIVMLQRITNHIEQIKPDPQPARDSSEQEKQNLMSALCDIAFAGIEHNLCTQRRVANRIQLGSPEACGKMQVLLPLLRHWRKKGQKVLVFSRSTRLLDILEACLWQQGWSPQVLRLDGGTPPGNRQRLVDEFNSSSTRGIFLISTRAGGVGLNLTSASVVVIFDPDWNPFSDLQAQDRSFRIGQTRVVEVYRLLGAGTIEEQVYVRQVWKQQLAATAIDGMRTARRLDNGAVGLKNLLELHDSSVLPTLMAEAFKTRSTKPHETSEAGVQVFEDLRSAACAELPVQHLLRTESDEENIESGKEEAESDVERTGGKEKATQALERLHGMFDQVDHSKLFRADTQEAFLLDNLQDDL
eukprot:TRINITY_DN41550_c0_g1_i1.p1 TRINITY_DN41550_c0_g1~~TRINITY_DN41550_c0_g1_i1.p1  ORF type:complete len:1078 (+),score=163.53 TRINITY_DN41550_c0_g1_i1:101-3334(+)